MRENRVRVQTASPASVRQVNRSILLNLIRLHQPVSRAALSERTHIFRSSVSEIVDGLIAEGLVREERAVPNGRGRVPYHLYLNDAAYRVLGVSVRPARTRVALAGLSGSIEGVVAFGTPSEPRRLVRMLRRAAARLQEKYPGPVRECGISVPGLVEARAGVVGWAPALPGYSRFPLAEQASRALGVPVSCENDCNLGALAEMWLGERDIPGASDFVFIEIGSVGVGGGIILNSAPYRGHDGAFSAEFGHMVVDGNGPPCACGRCGCWESYVCDRATWARYAPRAPFAPERFGALLSAAAAGDRAARRALDETARWLSIGLANVAFALNPKIIVLAGEVTRAWELIGGAVEGGYAGGAVRLRVRPAHLDASELFLQGAVQLALSGVFARPKLGW